MRKPSLYVALAIGATLPGFCLRLPGTHGVPVLEAATRIKEAFEREWGSVQWPIGEIPK